MTQPRYSLCGRVEDYAAETGQEMLEAVMELSGTREAGSLTQAARERVRRRRDWAAFGGMRLRNGCWLWSRAE